MEASLLKGIHKLLATGTINDQRLQEALDLVKTFAISFMEEISAVLKKEISVEFHHLIDASVKLPEIMEKFTTERVKTKIRVTAPVFIRPREVPLGTRFQKGLKEGQMLNKEVTDSLEYYPIEETVMGVLKDRQKFDCICRETITPGIINTDLNGTRIQSLVEKAKQGPTLDGIPTIVVRVIDSCDDVEILNATSKKAGIHKTTGIYFSIPNLGPAESIKELYPLIICSAIDYKKYGPAKVFECFFEDLQNLNDKINVKEIHGKKFNLKIIRVGDTGDALGLNDWHGYRGTSSNSFCRTCLIQRKDFVENLNAEAKFRTIEDYCEIREKIQNAKTEKEKDEICKDWGLKTDVHLHQEPFFYTLGPDVHPFYQEIFDTMHDLLEGCSKLIANQIISFIIKNTQLSLIDINNRIKNFNYGPLSFKDKPLPITEAALTKGRDVGQSAVQSWVLIRILPFLIDDIKVKTKGKNDDKMNEKQISEKLENIKNLIGIHLDVLSIVLSKAMMQQNVDKLKSLIYEHNSLFQKLFPSAAKLNKFHHLLHYRNSILKNGPLAFWWTARFEAFHQYLKRISNSCRNYINLPKTLADRLSYTLSYNLSYPDEAVESQSGEDLTSIKLDKIWYNKNSLLCYSKPDELPLFGSIKKISYNQEAKEAKLTLKKFKTVGWNYNKHSYQVEREEGEVLVNPRNLAFKYPLDLWSLCDSRTEEKLFVSLKYLLISDIQ